MKIEIDSLIYNKHTGIIKKIIELKNEDMENYFTAQARLTNNESFNIEYPFDQVSSGTSTDSKQAIQASIGEGIERYCGNIIENLSPEYSLNELSKNGVKALDNKAIIEYKNYQYEDPKFPFKRFCRDSKTNWVKSIEIIKNEEFLVPMNLVYVNYYYFNPNINYNFPNLAGIAAGNERKQAIINSITEIIERDASIRWWYTKEIDGTFIVKDKINDSLSFYTYLLHSIVPTAAVFLFDDKNDLVNLGFACRFNIKDAIDKAKSEAVQLRQNALHLLRNIDLSDKDNTKKYLKSFKKNRNYIDSYRLDYRDMYDLIHNTQLYLDPKMKEKLSFYRSQQQEEVRYQYILSFERLLEYFKYKNQKVLISDITTKDIMATNIRVVRALMPGFIINGPTPYIPLEKSLLTEIPPIPHS